jgi:predicted RNase H-like HicB family nuclease
MAPNKLKVLVFPEEDGWVAVCLEHYVVGQGRGPERAIENLGRALAVHRQLDTDAEREPFADLPRAPETYWHRFDAASKAKAMRNTNVPVPPPWMIVEMERTAELR